jgi:hypothetical protein
MRAKGRLRDSRVILPMEKSAAGKQLFLRGEKQKTCNLRSKKGADFVCQKITD